MRNKLFGVAAMALLLTGCASPSPQDTANKCGGQQSGITINKETIRYNEDTDTTGTAWTCLVNELIPDKAEQYALTNELTPGTIGTFEANGYTITYDVSNSGSLRLFFN